MEGSSPLSPPPNTIPGNKGMERYIKLLLGGGGIARFFACNTSQGWVKGGIRIYVFLVVNCYLFAIQVGVNCSI